MNDHNLRNTGYATELARTTIRFEDGTEARRESDFRQGARTRRDSTVVVEERQHRSASPDVTEGQLIELLGKARVCLPASPLTTSTGHTRSRCPWSGRSCTPRASLDAVGRS
jgi:hypothetical protein